MDDSTVQPQATPSAPAPSATPAATTPGTMSARDALALADSSPAHTEPSTASAVDTTAAATAQSAETATTSSEPATTDAKGEPPKWRWQDILANARETAATEAETRVRQELDTRLKAFEGMDPSEVAGYRVLTAALAGDPQAVAVIRQHPEAMQALRAMVAEQQAATSDVMPEPDLQTGDGTPVYSAPQLQLWQEWNARKLTADLQAQFRKELGPVNEVISAHQTAKATATVTTALTEMRADADFKAHEADIKATLTADAQLWELADTNPKLALELAWNRVYRAHVLPRRDEATKAAVLANLQQRAVAGTTNPAAASTSAPPNMIGNARAALQYAESVVGAA